MKSANLSRALPAARGRRFGIVASRFHGEIVERLLEGAVGLLKRAGVEPENLRIERVPGAWEIPQGLDLLARTQKFDALISLGVLVRGETLHFELIARECARGIGEVAHRYGLPVTFGVLTCETMEQARARSGGAVGNQGEEAAQAALEMADLTGRIAG